MSYERDIIKFKEKAAKAKQQGSSVVIEDYYLDDLIEILNCVEKYELLLSGGDYYEADCDC